MNEELKIEVHKTPREIIINFNGLPHVMLDRRIIFGFQSWKNEKLRDEPMYSIEFYGRGENNMVLNYDAFDKWASILMQLSTLELFAESEIP